MEKLQPEDIACFLPYDLKLYNEWQHNKYGSEYRPTTLSSLGRDNLFWVSSSVNSEHLKETKYKPILREFDLTKPIIHNRVEVIPIIELAKIATNVPIFLNKPVYNHHLSQLEITGKRNYKLVFTFDIKDKSFVLMQNGVSKTVSNQLQLFQKLYEWKFDIDNLIGRGLAVSASTLDINPYDK